MREVPISKGYVAFVDDEDYERVSQWKWHAKETKRKDGVVVNVYAKRRKWEGRTEPNGNVESLHRFVMDISDPNIEIDHKNCNGLDCQKENLRVATAVQNRRNLRKRSGLHTSRYKGVGWWKYPEVASQGYWRVRVKLDGKEICRVFHNELRAAVEYDWLALSHYRDFARTNFTLCPLKILEADNLTTQ